MVVIKIVHHIGTEVVKVLFFRIKKTTKIVQPKPPQSVKVLKKVHEDWSTKVDKNCEGFKSALGQVFDP